MTNEAVDTPVYLADYIPQIDALRELGYIYWQNGWSLATSSNYSVLLGRDPAQILITASGKNKARLTRNDFVIVDAQGNRLHEDSPRASAETLLHCVVYECFPDAGAVLHTHSPWATVLSQRYFSAGGILLHDFEMLKGLRDIDSHQRSVWVPIFDNTQDIPALAEQVRMAAQPQSAPAMTHAFLIRQHGIYTWGRDLEEAARHVEALEFLLECLGRIASIS